MSMSSQTFWRDARPQESCLEVQDGVGATDLDGLCQCYYAVDRILHSLLSSAKFAGIRFD